MAGIEWVNEDGDKGPSNETIEEMDGTGGAPTPNW